MHARKLESKRNRRSPRLVKMRNLILFGLCAILLIGPSLNVRSTSPAPAGKAASGVLASTSNAPASALSSESMPYYADAAKAWERERIKPANRSVTVAADKFARMSAPEAVKVGPYQGEASVLIWNGKGSSWIEYDLNIPEDGLYEMALDYHPYTVGETGSNLNRRPVMLGVTIDGQTPFREARAIPFRRWFKDQLPVKQNKAGDDIRPKPVAKDAWQTEPFRDATGAYDSPLRWHFTAGHHTVRLTAADPIVLRNIVLSPPKEEEAYAETLSQMPKTSLSPKARVITIQAEEMTLKNDVAIQMLSDTDPLTLPKAGGAIRFNTMGGNRWAGGGQAVSWSFEVTEAGRYLIALRYFQGYVSNLSSYRNIFLDGKSPAKEWKAYRFPYDSKWQGKVISDGQGRPMEVYLEKGTHTLTMEATIAPYHPVIRIGEQVSDHIREVAQDLKALTGGQVDRNRTWNMEAEFPAIPGKLSAIRDEMVIMADQMLAANGGTRDNTVQTIRTTIGELDTYIQAPNKIPYYSEDIYALQERLGQIRETLMKAPLMLDQIVIVPSGMSLPKMEAGWIQRLQGAVMQFFYSFTRNDDLGDMEADALNVWVYRGRDYVNLLQELADEWFTPETGIPVKLNLLPSENLLVLANAAGLSPDVALGQPQDKSIDFAMRNALQNLREFPDFEQIESRFAPGAMLPFHYNGGTYALPETQSFKVMFYRKDIMNELGLSLPNTWEELYQLIPSLQQKGYNFYMTPADFIHFFYQNGSEIFERDGLSTALDTPEAFYAFKQWTDLFHIYDLDQGNPNFYQHFRKGTMPIGIADFNQYIQMTAAAPELTGFWGIAPIPGTKRPDGSIVRWAAGGQTAAFVYKNSTRKDEAWIFLKWLLSADVQERYGMDLESFNGVTFRWNTANIEAFTRLPWPREDLNVILEQWRWYKELPNLPGSYFVPRELNNAWNRTVVDKMNYRESLELAQMDIDREMLRKSQEFGFVDGTGKPIKALSFPLIDKPWEGVSRYVHR